MINKLLDIPFKIRILLEIFVIALIAGAFYFFIFSPLQQKVTELEQEYDGLVTKINSLMPYKASMEQFRKQLQMVQRQFNMVLEVLPNEKSYYLLYDEVVGLAEKNNLKTLVFQPAGEKKIDDFHSSVVFNINMEGSFLSVVSFLYNLNYLDKIVNLNNLRINSKTAQDGTEFVTLTASLNSYRFNTGSQ